MSVARVVCVACSVRVPVRRGCLDRHLHRGPEGTAKVAAWCPGSGRRVTLEEYSEAVLAALAAAEGDLRTACRRFELAELEVRGAYITLLRRRAWARALKARAE